MASINLGGSVGTTAAVAILGSYNVVFTSDGDHTLTSAEFSNKFLHITSSVSLTATRNLIAPLTQGQEFVVQNNTTGGQSIQIIGSSGAGVLIADGYTLSVVCDGHNYIITNPAGPPGPQGPIGPVGPTGPVGPAGTGGQDGYYSCPLITGPSGFCTPGAVVYSSGSDSVDLADNRYGPDGAPVLMPAIGVVVSNPTSTMAVVRYAGELSIFTGLTVGATYYVGEVGTMTTTVPSDTGGSPPPSVVQVVGFAKDATTLVVKIGSIIQL